MQKLLKLHRKVSAIRTRSVAQSRGMGGYWSDWGIYQTPACFAADLTTDGTFNSVNYAFFKLNEDGTIDLFDPWSDEQIDTRWNYQNLEEYWGNLLGLRKMQALSEIDGHRVNTAFSIGGWQNDSPGIDPKFSKVASTPDGREKFADAAIEKCRKYGFDRIDIDWEYPSASDAENYALLLETLRNKLNENEDTKNITISLAVPAGHQKELIDWKRVSKVVDHVNMMTYDMSGTWDALTGHQCPIERSGIGDLTFNMRDCIEFYKTQGFRNVQLKLGVPMYFRTFAGVPNINNGEYQSHKGPGSGDAGPGFKFLSTVWAEAEAGQYVWYWDEKSKASWAYNPQNQEYATGCSPQALSEIRDFAKEQGIEVFSWEARGDITSNWLASRILNGEDYTPGYDD